MALNRDLTGRREPQRYLRETPEGGGLDYGGQNTVAGGWRAMSEGELRVEPKES